MLFNSLGFLFGFLPISLLGFEVAGRFGRRAVLLWLTAASLVFYAAWNSTFLLLLLGSVLANFLVSKRIASFPPASASRRRWLYLGVSLNLAALFYYKYLFHLLRALASSVAGHRFGMLPPHPILLPLGLSFFTFTQIGYLVDLAQEQAEPQDLPGYLLFVTFFPHLIAGPLLHHREMMPQFDDPGAARGSDRRFRLRSGDLSVGLTQFVLGLAKKVLLADKLAPAADLAFSGITTQGALDAWSGLLIYCMQLYFDFSGYSDMAIGLARMFGLRFPVNFDSPWKATSVAEYWQRWHITLTRYITSYLYNPLLLRVQRRRMADGKGVSRRALATVEGFTTMIALPTLCTMVLTGIWHGAGLQFVLFGSLHGVYLTANQAWRHFHPVSRLTSGKMQELSIALRRFGVMVQVGIALVFFRAASLRAALQFAVRLAGSHGMGEVASPVSCLAALALLPVVWYLPNTQQLLGQSTGSAPADTLWRRLRWQPTLRWALGLAIVFFACLTSLDQASSFVYFQF